MPIRDPKELNRQVIMCGGMALQKNVLREPFIGERKSTTKKLCDKDFAKCSGELSGAICLQPLVLLGIGPVTSSNRSENSLVLFVRFVGFVGPDFREG